jgi:competence protein ComEC
VLHVDGAFGSVLLTGDVEQLAERRLQAVAGIAADVAIVPHHGSLTSSSPGFVAAVSAKLAIVSAGFNNRWGFPRPEVVDRWQASGARVLVTGDLGAITVLMDAAGTGIGAERERRRRYWQPQREPVSGVPAPSAL